MATWRELQVRALLTLVVLTGLQHWQVLVVRGWLGARHTDVACCKNAEVERFRVELHRVELHMLHAAWGLACSALSLCVCGCKASMRGWVAGGGPGGDLRCGSIMCT